MSENQWMVGLKKGDRIVVNNIYEKFFPSVRHWVIQNNGSEQDAYDLFHDSLETILLKIDHVHTSFGALVLKIAKFKWYDSLKRVKVDAIAKSELKHDIENSTSINDLIKTETEMLRHRLLDATFKLISETCQELIDKIKQGKKVEEIVVEMNFKSANTLYRRKAACVEKWSNLVKSDSRYNELKQ